MSSPLVTLAPEIVYNIIKELPVEYGRNLLATCKKLYENGVYAFDEKCFRAIPVNLTEESLDQAKQLLENHSIHFLQEIFIRFRTGLDNHDPERLDIGVSLILVLTQGLQASTKPLTISIYDHPDRSNDPSGSCMWTVAQAISTILLDEPFRSFKVQIQNLRLTNCRMLYAYGRPFLDRVQSLELRFDYTTERRSLRAIKKVLHLTSNLEELSFSNNAEEYLSSETFQQIIPKSISKKLKRVHITRISISADKLRQALSPFRSCLRDLELEDVVFEEKSFGKFVDYAVKHLAITLHRFSLKDIYDNRDDDAFKIPDPMKECREIGVVTWGFDIMKSLDS